MLAQHDGRLPIPAKRRLSQHVVGVKGGAFPRGAVGAHVPPKLIPGVHHVVVPRIDFNLHAVAATQGREPVVAGLVPSRRLLGGVVAHPSAVVLKASVDAVGLGVVHLYGIKLTDGRAVALGPVLASVPRHIDAAVVAVDEVVGVGGIHPQFVVIHVHVGRSNGGKRGAAIGRFEQGNAGDVHRGGVRRVHTHQPKVVAVRVAHVVQRGVVRFDPCASLLRGRFTCGQGAQLGRRAFARRCSMTLDAETIEFGSDDLGVEQRPVAVGQKVVECARRQFS